VFTKNRFPQFSPVHELGENFSGNR
jgi:hypothetical protein